MSPTLKPQKERPRSRSTDTSCSSIPVSTTATFRPEKSVWSNPGITAAATHWLADRGSRLHGVEGPSTDRPTDNLFPNHRTCRDRRISHYEWLCNLEDLVGRGEFQFQGLPLKIHRGSGSPVRAIATLD